MTQLAKRILLVFAESYPTSAHYKGGRKLRKAGWELRFPRIKDDVNAKNEFLDAIDELVEAHIVSAKWKRFRPGDELDALYLEEPSAMFEALGLESPESTAQAMIDFLQRREQEAVEGDVERGASPNVADAAARRRLQELSAYLLPRLEAGHPVPVQSAAELADIHRLFSLSNETSLTFPIRALSIRLYGNSKRLEQLLPAADRLSRAMWGAPISEELGLSRAYPEVGIALRGKVSFHHEEHPWRCTGQMVTLPIETVRLISAFEPDATVGLRVLSIENKETFHLVAGRPPEGVSAVVYTAGHPNSAVITVLRLFAAAGASLYHYGDLDPDGLLILQEICAAVAVPVTPYLMTVAVHRRFARFGRKLEQSQLARLSLLDRISPTVAELRDLAWEIGDTGIGVEQEIIGIDV